MLLLANEEAVLSCRFPKWQQTIRSIIPASFICEQRKLTHGPDGEGKFTMKEDPVLSRGRAFM
jgi:hypothetical protein